MDLSKVEVSKTAIITGQLYPNNTSANGVFSASPYVPFIPDIMVVKYIYYYPSYGNDYAKTGPFPVYCDLIGDIIGFLPISYDYVDSNALPMPPVYGDAIWTLKKPISTITFTVQNRSNQVQTDLQGVVIVCLEFVKFKSEKPQKVY